MSAAIGVGGRDRRMVLYTNDEQTARLIADEIGTHFEMHEQMRHAEEIFLADRQAEYDRWEPLMEMERRLRG